MTTPSRVWDLADADPVGAVTGWLAGHPDLGVLQAAEATGAGRWVGVTNAPPFPRLRITDTGADLRALRGPSDVTLSVEVLGDLDGRPGKAALRRFAVACVEALDEVTERPDVGGCVFSRMTVGGPYWSPLPPGNQPRYVFTATLRYRPSWGR